MKPLKVVSWVKESHKVSGAGEGKGLGMPVLASSPFGYAVPTVRLQTLSPLLLVLNSLYALSAQQPKQKAEL